jgi:hypothetical protein
VSARVVRGFSVLATVAAGLLVAGGPASRADIIPITFAPGGPNFSVINAVLTYDAGTGHFVSTSTPVTLNSTEITPTGFARVTGTAGATVDLFVDRNGNFVSSGAGVLITGTVSINGTVVSGPSAADPLLAGMITAFGADRAGPPTWNYDGLFTTTGGELTKPIPQSGGGALGPFFLVGSNLNGFLLDAENVTSGILGNFSQSFSSSAGKGTIGATIPEPGSLALAALAAAVAAGACWAGRRAGRGRNA